MIRRVARNLSWRRGILLVATVAVGITLLARERRLEAWTAEVVEATRTLVADVEAGRAVGDQGLGIVVGSAVDAIRGLTSPRTVGPATRIDGDELRVVRVEVRGGDGAVVVLAWAGRPPQLRSVERSVAVAETADSNTGGSR